MELGPEQFIKCINSIQYNTNRRSTTSAQEYLLKIAKTTTTTMDEELILYAVEKILKRHGTKVLVKWLGYDVPTWEPASSIQ